MLFNSGNFAVFLVVVLLVDMVVRRKLKLRYAFLLAASYFFYGCWNAKYLVLIIFSTLLDYVIGGLIHNEDRPGRRKLYLFFSVSGNLGVLALFKYGNFFIDNITAAFPFLGDIPHLDVLLPVGISFYTFQTLSYTIDIYRRKLEPSRSLVEFALFVSFFPQLVAGPIVRASHFLPQLGKAAVITDRDASRGLFLIARGLFKKMIIADVLAVGIVDRVFADPAGYGGLTALFGVYAYAFQIYGDFSGYSDIAIGCGRLLGFNIPKNFDSPYKAVDLRDFWRRWHISLSTWLRDYLYIPLGGSRKGPARTYVSLIATMLLGGLWHGAGWTFVLWGLYHGTILAVTRILGSKIENKKRSPMATFAKAFVTFHIVCLGWVLFRAQDLGKALDLLAQVLGRDGWGLDASPGVLIALGAAFLCHMMPRKAEDFFRRAWDRLPAPALAALLILLVGACSYLSSSAKPFIYFQF